jgi:hypothetical protein
MRRRGARGNSAKKGRGGAPALPISSWRAYCDFEPGLADEPAVPLELPLSFCGFVVSALDPPELDEPLALDPEGDDEPELPVVAGGLEDDELDDDGAALPEVPDVVLLLDDLLPGEAGVVDEPEDGAVVDDEDERAGGLAPLLLLFELLSPQAAMASTPAIALAMRNRVSMNSAS